MNEVDSIACKLAVSLETKQSKSATMIQRWFRKVMLSKKRLPPYSIYNTKLFD